MKPLIFLSLQPTRKDQAVALLELLLRKDNRAYISFYNALVKETYNDLASLLHGDLPCISTDAHKSSSDNCTPYGDNGDRLSNIWKAKFLVFGGVILCTRKDENCLCYSLSCLSNSPGSAQ